MSRTFNLWILAQTELLQIASRAHDFLAAHGLASGSELHRQVLQDAGHQAEAAPLAHADTLEGVHTAFPPELPIPHIAHDF